MDDQQSHGPSKVQGLKTKLDSLTHQSHVRLGAQERRYCKCTTCAPTMLSAVHKKHGKWRASYHWVSVVTCVAFPAPISGSGGLPRYTTLANVRPEGWAFYRPFTLPIRQVLLTSKKHKDHGSKAGMQVRSIASCANPVAHPRDLIIAASWQRARP